MKDKLLLIIPVFLFFINCGNSKKNVGFEISGEIRNSKDQIIYLSQVFDNQLIIIDSCEISEQKFSFTGKLELPELFYISDAEFQNYIPIFIENSNISLYAKNLQFSDLKLEGSDIHKEFTDFHENFSVYQKKYSYFLNQISDTILLQNDSTYQTIKAERIDFLKNYIKVNKNSVVSLYIIYKILMYDIPKNETFEIMLQFSDKCINSRYYSSIIDFLNK